MDVRHKVLVLDDDPDLLDLYRDMLARLPSHPEIHTASSGSHAIALLESGPFSLLLCDLNMPKMDGLQVLAIVRRKFPQLRTAVMTSVLDEQFRMRAYAMGVDLYLEKPNNSEAIKLFLDCIESLLGQENQGGFRGVQSKSLVDILQLEGLSRNSSVLKVTNGLQEGRIWFTNGEVIDAATQDFTGEEAFQRILSWKTGSFEVLPADPGRSRTIFTSFQGLLLETARVLDEAQEDRSLSASPGPSSSSRAAAVLSKMAGFKGVEFLIAIPHDPNQPANSWGAENADQLVSWARNTWQNLQSLSDSLEVGELTKIDGTGMVRHISMAARGDVTLCVGFNASYTPESMQETMKDIVLRWVS
ncbi:MAG TPA: response regulator [Candidatus Paceibacterota bacterium]|nr:response regulator [Verrucomicrobiota bacterium]HRY50641.1 response regulator [Candidatus Paceibacterota bacterium]HSA00761.1 response regulator [Candidatus Paceibacterota bacterium]